MLGLVLDDVASIELLSMHRKHSVKSFLFMFTELYKEFDEQLIFGSYL